MVTEDQIIHVALTESDMSIARKHAEACSTGKTSHVHADKGEREERLFRDQLVGQLGQIAGYHVLYGHLHDYMLNRYYQNKYPYKGDLGQDVAASNIDFKTSYLISKDRPILDYHLAVRPAEMHPDWVYVLILVEPVDRDAYIVGWATTDMLPKKPAETNSVFSGAHILVARDLHPFPPFKWKWFKKKKKKT